MRKILPLDPHIVSKIAAGEVIERPVFAVKELVENSVDAGADTITVLIEESGLKKICVIDNGEGMSKDDLLESFKLHTTSKLTNEDALTRIQSLGFRGEALASIAAISRLTISSRIANEAAGASIVLKNGKVEKITPIGMPPGTQVTVDYLFHSVPARKKFLKSQRTEFRHIVDLLTHYALAYPGIHFVLKHNNKTILDLPKTTEQLQRIEALLGKDMFQALLPISHKDAYVTISGFIAKPLLTTRTPSKQFLFVNDRQIRDKGLSLKIKSSYGTLLENSVYPICVLAISMPFEMVDVNVHPRKEEVRFSNQEALYEAIETVIKQTLASHTLLPSYGNLSLGDKTKTTESYAGKLLKEKKFPWELDTSLKLDSSKVVQMHNLYLLVPTQNGMVMIDQHAAHERVRYEQLLEAFQQESKKHSIFQLPKPGIFELSLSESETMQEYRNLFQSLGWGVEHFKGTTYLLTSMPVLFQDRDYVQLLQEMLEDLQENGKPQALDVLSKKMLAYLACHSAVRAGDSLTKKQAKELVEQLEKTPNNATCPHGRPTRISFDLAMLHKMFKR